MTRTIRTFTALFLALILGLTSHSLAMARGMAGPAGQVELCTSAGPTMMYVDEDGQPVGQPHFCPDCALHLLSGVFPPETKLRPVAVPAQLHLCWAADVAVGTSSVPAVARGPPCMI